MDPNPLAQREKALENQYIREKEIRMAKERAAKAAQTSKEKGEQSQQSGQGKQA